MATLTRANRELFKRAADESFESLTALLDRCKAQRDASQDRWHAPKVLSPVEENNRIRLWAGNDGSFDLNDWSFTQLCQVCGVSKETVNKLTCETAAKVLAETMPSGNKPLQVFTADRQVRSIHGVGYTRLHNADLLSTVLESAPDFMPPQKAAVGTGAGTGLYAGEQDLFCFLIDPLGWTEIDGEAFAPGFFVWNSEVGKRTVGIETFWFQAVCQNHIVWDAVEVIEVERKHTARVHESLGEIRRALENLIAKRDERRDGFAKAIKSAMQTSLGTDAEAVEKVLANHGIGRTLAKQALEIARERGRFTIFALVDALTQLSAERKFIAERTDADCKASQLLQLALAA